ncbi:Monoglyceride lipase [Lachancea thermotolerans]
MFFFSGKKSAPIDFPYKPTSSSFIKDKHQFDGADFTYVKWFVATEQTPTAKARLLVVHGFDEYTLLYSRLMDQLSKVGIESFAFDQRGSGETSPGKQRGRTNEYHTFNDLDHFIEWNLEDKDPETPLFLFGHSMGGGIVLNYGCAGRFRDQIAGIVCTGPLIELHPHSAPSRLVTALSPLLAACLPNFRIDTGLDIDATTSDERYRNFLSRDPLTVPLYGSLRQIYDFLTRGKKLLEDKEYVAKLQKPVLIFHGISDTINDPKASEKFNKLCTATDKRLELVPGARHSLCLETDEVFERMFNDMHNWLLEHAP